MRSALLILVGILAFATPARSAIVTWYVDGSYTDARMGLAPQPFSSTSSVVNLELDSDGNGVDGDVTLLSASLNSSYFLAIDGLGFLQRTDSFTLAGGTGVLSGNEILWTGASGVQSHSIQCSGTLCSLFGLPDGGPPTTIPPLEAFFGQPPDLGRWILSEDHSQILGSTRAVFTVAGFVPGFELGEPVEWLVFGASDLGFVPEPAAAVLLLLALAPALRRFL